MRDNYTKQNIIVVAIVVGALALVMGFIAGTLLTMPDQQKIQVAVNDIQAELKAKINELNQLKTTNKQNRTQLKANIAELNELKQTLFFNELKQIRNTAKDEDIIIAIPQLKEKTASPIQVLTKPIFGIYLGENLNQLRKRFKISPIDIDNNDDDPTQSWRINNDIDGIKHCLVVTFESQIWGISVIFTDASEDNFKVIEQQLRNKYQIRDESQEWDISPNISFLTMIENIDVIIRLELEKEFMEDNTLSLYYSHIALFNTSYAEKMRRKAAKINMKNF